MPGRPQSGMSQRSPLGWWCWFTTVTCLILILQDAFKMTACSFIFQSSHRHHRRHHRTNRFQTERWWALSDDFLESDLVAVRKSPDGTPRLCAVKPDGTVAPLCQRHDDVETDLFCDPREFSERFWENLTDEAVSGRYGEGFYGQRPVPSLGGGPGYGADADEIWSVSEDEIERIRSDGVELPVLDVGIAHGEKARGGSS
jgi:hypothetical protein